MGRPCKVCTHPRREAIDKALAAETDSYLALERRHYVTADSLRRHKLNHLATGEFATVEVGALEDLSAEERLAKLEAAALAILQSAQAQGKAHNAIAAIRECRQIVELIAKIRGELNDRPQVNVLNVTTSDDWLRLRAGILDALSAYPDARAAVGRQLLQLEGGS